MKCFCFSVHRVERDYKVIQLLWGRARHWSATALSTVVRSGVWKICIFSTSELSTLVVIDRIHYSRRYSSCKFNFRYFLLSAYRPLRWRGGCLKGLIETSKHYWILNNVNGMVFLCLEGNSTLLGQEIYWTTTVLSTVVPSDVYFFNLWIEHLGV